MRATLPHYLARRQSRQVRQCEVQLRGRDAGAKFLAQCGIKYSGPDRKSLAPPGECLLQHGALESRSIEQTTAGQCQVIGTHLKPVAAATRKKPFQRLGSALHGFKRALLVDVSILRRIPVTEVQLLTALRA